jgi:hypothetical protein
MPGNSEFKTTTDRHRPTRTKYTFAELLHLLFSASKFPLKTECFEENIHHKDAMI